MKHPANQLDTERIHLLLIDEVHKGLDDIAAGRTQDALEAIAELRQQLQARKAGTLLAGIGREVGGIDLEIERDQTPTEPMSFE